MIILTEFFTNQIAEEYFTFIQESTKFGELNKDHVEIITPFVDSTGESISFSVYHDNNNYILSDDGFTVWDLSINGIDVTKEGNRKNIFDSNIKYHGFNFENNKIIKSTTKKHLGQSIHDMTQLLINVYDLTYLHRNIISNQFFIDVKEYFSSNSDDFSYFPNFNIRGKSQLNHQFDFVFLKEGKRKLTKVEKNITKNKLDSILTSWLDTIESREDSEKEELMIILSNQGYRELKTDHKVALEQYGINVIDFSNKKDIYYYLAS